MLLASNCNVQGEERKSQTSYKSWCSVDEASENLTIDRCGEARLQALAQRDLSVPEAAAPKGSRCLWRERARRGEMGEAPRGGGRSHGTQELSRSVMNKGQ